MSNRIGPKLTIIYSCDGCDFYEFKSNSPPQDSTYICNKLGKRLFNIVPDEKCPFKINNAKIYHANEIERINKEELNKLDTIIDKIFPDSFDRDIENNKISFVDSSIDANDIKKLNLEFPNLDWSISTYDSRHLTFSATI